MNNLFTILKATFINDFGLNAFSKTVASSKEKKKILTQSIIMLVGITAMVYTVTMYDLLLADSLEKSRLLAFILIFGILTSVLITFFTSVYKAQGSLFTSRDYELLMSLPIKPNVILMSKLINLLLLNWVFTAFLIMPSGIIYYLRTDNISWIYFVMLIISIFFIPLLPVVIAALTSLVISYFASKVKYKNLIIIVGTMILIALIMIFSFQMQNLLEYIFSNTNSIINGLARLYPPLIFLSNALVQINLIEFYKFILVSIIPLILFVFLFSRVFNKINLKLSETHKKADYKIISLKKHSVLGALLKKEIKGYLSTPIYFINTAIGMFMALIASIATLFIDSKTLAMYMDIPHAKEIFPLLILGIIIFCIGLSSTTNSSISLEGKNLWIIKSLPIKEIEIFLGKIFLSLLITLPSSIIVNILFFLGVKFSISYLIWNLVISTLFCFFGAILGLVINIYFPKLEWSTPTVVVKQSISVMINMFIIFACVGFPAALFIFFKITNITVFLSILLAGLILLLVIIWSILTKKCVKKFKEL